MCQSLANHAVYGNNLSIVLCVQTSFLANNCNTKLDENIQHNQTATPKITKQNNEKIHYAITEVGKEDCIVIRDFNHVNIKWDTHQSTGVEDQKLLCLLQNNFLTQHGCNEPEQRGY